MAYYVDKRYLTERNYSPIPFEAIYEHSGRSKYAKYYEKNREWIEKYLSPSVKAANCGWDGVKYIIMHNEKCDDIREYALLTYPDSEDEGRYICIEGDSLGCIGEEVWTTVFAR